MAATAGSAGALFVWIATIRPATQQAWGSAALAALLAVGLSVVSWYGGLGVYVRWRFGVELEHAERLGAYLRMSPEERPDLVRQDWEAGERIPQLHFLPGDRVVILSVPEAQRTGVIRSLAAFEPEPVFVVEVEPGTETLEVPQSSLRLAINEPGPRGPRPGTPDALRPGRPG